ncbi:MAG TPA: CDP-glycerol glycerophosphotransferase family protein [Thermoleophilaceae bacterium]
MPLISAVVPIYNVEDYLRPCLESIAAQTVQDFEVIMVNDGSTDGSAAIAEEFAAADPRFILVTQPNGGLSRARNTGSAEATGEYLWFVDSDDLIPADAFELLVTPLQETGSDFATGNANRLTETGIVPARFLARAFERTRLRTHITKFRPLLADRTAWNKLWRRSFWEENGFRFPDGRIHEDIPVTLPAHFKARSVDVIAEPVYLYRVREGANLSITQRRLENKALLDRMSAVEEVRDFLAKEGPRRARRWYEQSVVEEDLRYYLDVLGGASDEYRELFLDRANAFLEQASRGIYRDLPAIDRLKWHLVRRRMMPELLQVLRFQRERLRETPPVRVGRRWYGDYPFRTDPELKIPRSVYRLREELVVSPRVDDLRFDGDELKIGGYAFISGLGAPERDSQRVTVTVVRRGRLLRVRMRTSAIRLRAQVVHRPEVTANTSQASADAQWSGFEATLPPGKLRSLGRWRPGTWDLYVTVRAGGVTRRRSRFFVDSPRPVRAVDHVLSNGMWLKATPAQTGEIALHLRDGWASIVSHRLVDGAVELSGRMHGAGTALRLARPGSQKLEFPLERSRDSGEFSVRVPLDELASAAERATSEPQGSDYAGAKLWNLWVVGKGAGRRRVSLEEHVREGSWPCGHQELALVRTKDGDAVLLARTPQPLVDEALWTDSGELELSGELGAGGAQFQELLLVGRHYLLEYAFPLRVEGSRFRATLTPGHVRSLAGELPLREGKWDLFAREDAEGARTPVLMTQQLYERLPMEQVIRHKTFLLTVTPQLQVVVTAHRDLDDDGERGRFHQNQLREHVYTPAREQPLRDAVVFISFGGRQYADSPRALHEELLRRGSSLEHLWVVRDGRAAIPPGGTVIRAGSREYYEAMARARFVVANVFLPKWFRSRPDQVVVQTLQGTPLKRVGLDVPHLRSTMRLSWHWEDQMASWKYLLSASGFASPILRDAYGFEGEILELGLPRNDVLAGPGREQTAREVRRALGIPEGDRVVLYAPTFRDHVVDRRGRHRMDQHLDVAPVLDALGPDAWLLIRKHPSVADAVDTGGLERVLDVSMWPSANELLAAADVLITDYSALAFDFANTGRPMIFFAYDLDTYRDEIRGFYIDYEAEVPGPIVRTTDELADALRSLDGAVPPEYADRYRAWRQRFCPLDDGEASARLIERLFAASA